MEDFGSVLWVVIILGAMVFNFVAQSRKNRDKRGTPDPHHGEAWPTSAMPEASHSDSGTEKVEKRGFQPVIPAFPDESQSLEQIPEREYVPEFTVQHAADPGLFRTQTANRLTGDATAERRAPAGDITAEHATAEETASSIAENFDLRQAVIYSEILKPKFND